MMKKLLSILVAVVILASSFCTVASAYAAGSPQSTSITSVKAYKKGFTVKWKKKSKISGYQIQYSTSSKFKNAKSVKIKKAKTTSKKITGLKASKKYYVRIRTYKNKKYSKWSKKKSVTTKATATTVKTSNASTSEDNSEKTTKDSAKETTKATTTKEKTTKSATDSDGWITKWY